MHAPSDPEELRIRYELIANSWLYATLRHPGRAWLKDMDHNVYRNLANFVLGPKVYGLTNKAGRQPEFSDILHYERRVREKAYELVRDGDDFDQLYTLKAALVKACKDPETRQLHFVSRFTDSASDGAWRGNKRDRE